MGAFKEKELEAQLQAGLAGFNFTTSSFLVWRRNYYSFITFSFCLSRGKNVGIEIFNIMDSDLCICVKLFGSLYGLVSLIFHKCGTMDLV